MIEARLKDLAAAERTLREVYDPLTARGETRGDLYCLVAINLARVLDLAGRRSAALDVGWPLLATRRGPRVGTLGRTVQAVQMMLLIVSGAPASRNASAESRPADAAAEIERLATLAAEILPADHALLADIRRRRDARAGSRPGGN